VLPALLSKERSKLGRWLGLWSLLYAFDLFRKVGDQALELEKDKSSCGWR
jgi:hypothetical protein